MAATSSKEQQYWLPGYGLSRNIVLRQLQFFLGPSATARPYSYHGREGYLITGAPLTKEQIEDLRRQSKEYERQQTARMSGKINNATEGQETDINEPVVVKIDRRSSPTSSSRYRHR